MVLPWPLLTTCRPILRREHHLGAKAWPDKFGTRPMGHGNSNWTDKWMPVRKHKIQPECEEWGSWCRTGLTIFNISLQKVHSHKKTTYTSILVQYFTSVSPFPEYVKCSLKIPNKQFSAFWSIGPSLSSEHPSTRDGALVVRDTIGAFNGLVGWSSKLGWSFGITWNRPFRSNICKTDLCCFRRLTNESLPDEMDRKKDRAVTPVVQNQVRALRKRVFLVDHNIICVLFTKTRSHEFQIQTYWYTNNLHSYWNQF